MFFSGAIGLVGHAGGGCMCDLWRGEEDVAARHGDLGPKLLKAWNVLFGFSQNPSKTKKKR